MALSWLIWGDLAMEYMVAARWNVAAIYSSVFDVTTVFTAFLFTFFSIFATTDRGFIGKARGTLPFRRTIDYTISALVLGAGLIVATIPMLIITPMPMEDGLPLVILAAWMGLTIWTASAFTRAAAIFAIFAREHL